MKSGLPVALAAFVVYLLTLEPGISFIDGGELSTVAWTLGIAHPTGYPLFTLVGWCFAHAPILAEPVTRMNLMAALLCAAGVFVFYNVVLLFLREHVRGATGADSFLISCSAAGAAFLLAFSETYWSQAVAVEVYSLHLFLVLSTLYAFLRADISVEPAGSRVVIGRWWLLFAYALGLSFTNHMTTILLAPGFLYFYFARQGWTPQSWKRIALMTPPFVAGLSVYLYLPIRCAHAPVMNWGEPTSLERFLWHFSGKQFQVWIFSSTEAAGRQFSYFLRSLPSEHAYVGIALAVIGLIALWKRSRKAAGLTVLLFAGCVGYSINYDIHDIDSYFLLAYIVLALWAGCGLLVAGQWLTERIAWRPVQAAVCLVAAGLAPLAVHYRSEDQSGNHLVDDYTRNMFASVQPGGLILSFQWDDWVSAAYYEQLVKGVRPDVIVIDKELLRRSWYLLQLARRHPSVIEQSRAEVDAFLVELDKFEHNVPYDPAIIEARYAALIASFIRRNIDARPVYVTREIEERYTAGLQRVPEGLALRLYPDTLFHGTTLPVFVYRPLARSGRLEDALKTLYADPLVMRSQYYLRRGYTQEAEKSLKMALSFDPSNPLARRWLNAFPRQQK